MFETWQVSAAAIMVIVHHHTDDLLQQALMIGWMFRNMLPVQATMRKYLAVQVPVMAELKPVTVTVMATVQLLLAVQFLV